MPAVATFTKIEMRRDTARFERFRSCPWATAYGDPLVPAWLAAYGMLERFQEWPPGRRDPRLVAALVVIANEHARVDAEQRRAAAKGGKP